VGFFAAFLEAVVLLAVRLTGADATEAAGIVAVCVYIRFWIKSGKRLSVLSSGSCAKAARVHQSTGIERRKRLSKDTVAAGSLTVVFERVGAIKLEKRRRQCFQEYGYQW